MILLLLLAQAAAPAAPPAASPAPASAAQSGPTASMEDRYDHCLDRATADPTGAEAEAGQWLLAGGTFFARQCLGMAYAHEQRWTAAAAAFDAAARGAEKAGDVRSANYGRKRATPGSQRVMRQRRAPRSMRRWRRAR